MLGRAASVDARGYSSSWLSRQYRRSSSGQVGTTSPNLSRLHRSQFF